MRSEPFPPVAIRQSVPACPFNRIAYAASLKQIGEAELSPDGGFFVLKRRIPGIDAFDGMGPWPYMWVSDRGQVDVLRDGFRHLVTLTAVTQPGAARFDPGTDAVLLKHHYVYDPSLPAPALSPRARKRLAECERTATFETVERPDDRLAIVGLYDVLKIRRGFSGGFLDFDAGHFTAISRMEESVFFRVSRGGEIGGLACGVVFNDILQILHAPPSHEGLRWNASYLLMHGLQTYARERRLRLYLGGLPQDAAAGLDIFKRRWSNRMLPVHILRIVNDARRYAEICAMLPGEAGFFPAYRRRR